VTCIDPGVVSLVAAVRGHERQAAEELERWKTHHEERKVVDASPAAVTLALLLTDEELDSLEKRAGDGEIAGRGRKGGSTEASPQPVARHGEPAQVFPANAVGRGLNNSHDTGVVPPDMPSSAISSRSTRPTFTCPTSTAERPMGVAMIP
jgi:hypothetical protein